MFKSLAVSAAIFLSTLTGVAANAAPTTCAVRGPELFEEFSCDHHSRINANGHKVQDVTYFYEGVKYQWTMVFWLDNNRDLDYAEVWYNGKRVTMDAYLAKNAAICIDNNNHQFCFQPV